MIKLYPNTNLGYGLGVCRNRVRLPLRLYLEGYEVVGVAGSSFNSGGGIFLSDDSDSLPESDDLWTCSTGALRRNVYNIDLCGSLITASYNM